MAPPHHTERGYRERDFLEVLQNGCVLPAVLPSPRPWGAGVWVNTECTEIHHGPPWSANSCNLHSTLTLRKNKKKKASEPLAPAVEPFCGDSTIWFDVCVTMAAGSCIFVRAGVSKRACVCLLGSAGSFCRARGIMASLHLCVRYCRTTLKQSTTAVGKIGLVCSWLDNISG